MFFDDLWVTEADVLGAVDEGWKVVQEVLAFERVGIARYARCERLLQRAPAVLGDEWDTLPDELRGRWARHAHPLPAGPAARLPGGVAAGDAAGSAPATPRPTASR